MSQTRDGQDNWMNEVAGTSEEKRGPMHVVQPFVPLPHVGQLVPPEALRSGLDFFVQKSYQNPVELQPTQPYVGQRSETKLPGVRDLLMSPSYVSESRTDPSRRHFSAQDQLLPKTGRSVFSPIVLPARAESQPSGNNVSSPKHKAPASSWGWPGSAVDHPRSPFYHHQPTSQPSTPGTSHGRPLTPHALPNTNTFTSSQPMRTPPSASDSHRLEGYGSSPDDQVRHGEAGISNPSSVGGSAWDNALSRPEWGVTKAGKPRKRLALACLNCRQKKIRCHPNPQTMRCTHCERTGSYCRFEGGSRHSNPAASFRDQALQPSTDVQSGIADAKFPKRTADHLAQPDSNAQARPNTSGDTKPSIFQLLTSTGESEEGNYRRPSKRQRADTEPLDNSHRHVPSERLQAKSSSHITFTEAQINLEHIEDPFRAFPLSMEYLDLYFTHFNQATYCMFPKGPFSAWVRESRDKSLDDKMVLYTLMAMGCKFSDRKESHSDRANFMQIAMKAEQRNSGKYSLQLVQTRLILALILFSEGKTYEAWDFCGKTVRVVTGLQYNAESTFAVERRTGERLPYGLTEAGLAECCRRTFWSAYIIDHFSCFCAGRLSTLRNEDCFLRLPCDERLFETQQIPETPHFVAGRDGLDRLGSRSLGNMAYLVVLASTWNDLLLNLYRTGHRVPHDDTKYEKFYQNRSEQLRIFANKMPPHLSPCDVPNIEQALRGGYIGALMSLHGLYHMGHMKLNRHAASDGISQERLGRNLRAAQYHARELLKITRTLAEVYQQKSVDGPAWVFTTPFVGYSITTAVDILTSIGSLHDLTGDLPFIKSSLEVMAELSKHWSSSRMQLGRLGPRYEALQAALKDVTPEQKVFVTTQAMEDAFGKEVDLLFSPPLHTRLGALGLEHLVGGGAGIVTITNSTTASASSDWRGSAVT